MEKIIYVLLYGLSLGMMYLLVASGITLMFGIMHIVNFAHGAIYMVGAFCLLVLYDFLGINFLLSIFIIALAIGIVGIFIGRICFQPFRGELDRSFITSLGLILIIEASILVLFGNHPHGVRSPFSGVVSLAGIPFSWARLIVIGISSVAMAGLTLFIKLTKLGQAMIACSQDDIGAMLQGIDINKVSALCMFFGCALAAIAGVLMGTMFSIDYAMGGHFTVKCFVIVALGGLGSLPGAVLGALMLGYLEVLATLLTGASIGPLIAFTIVIVFLLFRPRGLLGHA